MNASGYIDALSGGRLDEELASLYGEKPLSFQRERYMGLAEGLMHTSGENEIFFFSVPGRTELGGNHTDHNHGKVLAGSITLDTAGAACKTGANRVRIESEGFGDAIVVSLDELAPEKAEAGKPESIVRGVASVLKKSGYSCGGFDACFSSTIPIGGGLSSSASFEVLVASIFNSLYNDSAVAETELAIACQKAENEFFGKPCGLMDQLTCATGGIVAIDFRNPEAPELAKLTADFDERGYTLVILGTQSHHADLTSEYAAIPAEMKAVARVFGASTLSEVEPARIILSANLVREKAGDRALLRALHFFDDTARVERQVNALANKDIGSYLGLVRESGDSSWKLLQNCYTQNAVLRQDICVALALTDRFLRGRGASRVHGSGFGGAIQAYIPLDMLREYIAEMEQVFGKGCVIPLRIRNRGALRMFDSCK